MPTVGVSPGTYTIAFNGLGGNNGAMPMPYAYQFSPFERIPVEPGYLNGPAPVAAGVRLDILGAVLGGILLTGLVIGALMSK